MSGEPAGRMAYRVAQILEQLNSFHYSSLSMNMPDAINGRFYATLKNAGEYDNVSRKLGYRFNLVSSTFPSTATVGSTISAGITITNSGYAATHNVRSIEYIFKNNSTGTVYKKPIVQDPRWWFGGMTKEMVNQVSLTGIPAGVYSIYLNLPDSETSLSTRPEYSIRLANTGVWEAATGYNSLLRNITIQ